jgi:hypothetical protein
LGWTVVPCLLAFAGCGADPATHARVDLGCGEIAGAEALLGRDGPKWVLVGESTESREAPLAVADLACVLATRGDRVWVGRADIEPRTDAESEMIARLDRLAANGAPISNGAFDPPLGQDATHARKSRSESERGRALAIRGKVDAVGATRVILLTSTADAAMSQFQSDGERFAGYAPMPMYLGEGGVLSLKVHRNEDIGAPPTLVRLHPERVDGFGGELLLARLTRPELEAVVVSTRSSKRANIAAVRARLEETYRGIERSTRVGAMDELRRQFTPQVSQADFRAMFWRSEMDVHQKLAKAHGQLTGATALDRMTPDERAAWDKSAPKAPQAISPREAQQRADAIYRVFMEEWRAQSEAIDVELPDMIVDPVVVLPEFVVE